MTYSYFKCEWIARPLKTASRGTGGALMDIYTIMTEQDCQLIMGEYTTWKVRPDGCHVIPFLVRVPAETGLEKCLNALKDYMQFTNIQPANEEDFVGDPDIFVLSAGTTDIVEVVEKMGEQNAKILACGG